MPALKLAQPPSILSSSGLSSSGLPESYARTYVYTYHACKTRTRLVICTNAERTCIGLRVARVTPSRTQLKQWLTVVVWLCFFAKLALCFLCVCELVVVRPLRSLFPSTPWQWCSCCPTGVHVLRHVRMEQHSTYTQCEKRTRIRASSLLCGSFRFSCSTWEPQPLVN